MDDFDFEIPEEYDIIFEEDNLEHDEGGRSVDTDIEYPKEDNIIPEYDDEHSFVYDEFPMTPDGLWPEYAIEEIKDESKYEYESESERQITTMDKIVYLERLMDEQMKLITRKTNAINLLAELYEKGTVSDSRNIYG